MPQPPDKGPVRTREFEARAAAARPTHLRTDLALIVLSVIWGGQLLRDQDRSERV